jgi:hypothetical protein
VRRDAPVFDVAVAQFETMDAPTAIVPVSCGAGEAAFYATYDGDEDWARLVRTRGRQAELAIVMCTRAYADARRHGGVPRFVRGAAR